MKTRVDELFREQVSRFRLRFACTDCAYWDTQQACCSHGYPCEPHDVNSLEGRTELFFCKEFELV